MEKDLYFFKEKLQEGTLKHVLIPSLKKKKNKQIDWKILRGKQ